MRWKAVATAAVAAAATLVAPSSSPAASPPDPHDPCARSGRDVCGTLGVGFYRTYRYGLRWFGDYRGAVPGAAHAFCLDLGYWYASRAYRYRPAAARRLLTRAGAPVSLERRRRIAYAIWRYGRSSDPARQAAVMLYVHATMGDGRPGEIDPAALGPRAAALYRRIARDTPRYHGPYRVEASLPSRLVVGRAAHAVIRVVSAHGRPLPDVRIALSAAGASGLPARARTGRGGVARVAVTPTAVSGLRLRVVTEPLAAPRPRVFVPTAAGAAANGQRLAAPASRRAASTVTRTDVGAAPRITTVASSQSAAPGARISDTVSVTGLGGGSAEVAVELWGPFERPDVLRCSGTPYWTGSFVAHGNGTTTTEAVALDRVGYYVYRESIAAHPPSLGFTTPCGGAAETVVVHARPDLSTAVSDQLVRPGARIFDRVRVQGLGASPAEIEVELYGPFGSRAAIRCTGGHLHWSGRVPALGSGEVKTPPVTVSRAGFYGFRERLLGSSLIAPVTTPCAPAAEVSLAVPRIVTGRGDLATPVAAKGLGAATPTRIRVASVGIDAPVRPAGIDVGHGVLGIPADIHRTGWWRDGAAPGQRHGAILVAGHVDSAREGKGAFFPLVRARPGDRVELVTRSGRRFAYRVATVRSYRKPSLPAAVFARTGPARLVLVTCGGPFDAATGHYRDDIVVTAKPET